jgi:hypothetical protein
VGWLVRWYKQDVLWDGSSGVGGGIVLAISVVEDDSTNIV